MHTSVLGLQRIRKCDGAQRLPWDQRSSALEDVARVPIHIVGGKAIWEDQLAAIQREPAEPVKGAKLMSRARAVCILECRVPLYRCKFDIPGYQERNGEDPAIPG